MKWSNIFEAICAAPSIFLDEITKGWTDFWNQEEQLAMEGELDEEEIEYEKENHLGEFEE